MEKQEAIREWCIEKAIILLHTNQIARILESYEVIKLARELEKYIKEG